MGIEVRFVDCKSLEGMYCRSPRTVIFLPSTKHRPSGRVTFTCAHELGHHELGHGTKADQYFDGHSALKRSPEELGADVFAAHFLMPRPAILAATSSRKWDVSNLTPDQAFSLAGLFGVGYDTLLWQLSAGLQLMPQSRFGTLSKHKPKTIRRSLCNESADSGLIVLDRQRETVPVDMELGDFIVADNSIALESNLLVLQNESDTTRTWKAVKVGVSRPATASAFSLIRVSKRGYVGSWKHRYLDEEG
jgi:Zn-dependent peptidase ImmA (M78 family)